VKCSQLEVRRETFPFWPFAFLPERGGIVRLCELFTVRIRCRNASGATKEPVFGRLPVEDHSPPPPAANLTI
jgi:hypothetical protein